MIVSGFFPGAICCVCRYSFGKCGAEDRPLVMYLSESTHGSIIDNRIARKILNNVFAQLRIISFFEMVFKIVWLRCRPYTFSRELAQGSLWINFLQAIPSRLLGRCHVDTADVRTFASNCFGCGHNYFSGALIHPKKHARSINIKCRVNYLSAWRSLIKIAY